MWVPVFVAWALVVGAGAVCHGEVPSSGWRVVERSATEAAETGELAVRVRGVSEGDSGAEPIPVRVVVTAADGSHPDGSGRGTYGDGRFFAEGEFEVAAAAGPARVELSSGPGRVPLSMEVEVEAGERVAVEAWLPRWFDPTRWGWYAADHHVHAQHDSTPTVETGLDYTALQARANGLHYVSEAGSPISYDRIGRYQRDDFVMHRAPELRPGPYVGHLITPGIERPIAQDRYEALIDRPLPGQAIRPIAHDRGGAMIYTHPMTPPHQLHWMGATEALSDGVLRRCADLYDVDGLGAQRVWFTLLNLGNRIGISSYTDAALGRERTLSPGDRRMYFRAERLGREAMAEALRAGRTFATDGGPVFAFVELDGEGPGGVIEVDGDREAELAVEIRSLHPLASARLYRRGNVVASLDVAGQRGRIDVRRTLSLADEPGWYVLRVEDERGHWAVTSPIYVESAREGPGDGEEPASLALLEITNTERYVKLRRKFFAHMIATVSPDQRIRSVALLRDGEVVRRFTPEEGDRRPGGKTPVTGMPGEYERGWQWHPGGEAEAERALHFQADWPVEASGWYAVEIVTGEGRRIRSDAIRFDAEGERSRAMSVANVRGGETELMYHGYGEGPALEELDPDGSDSWWYPRRGYWRLRTVFDGQSHELEAGPEGTAELFRKAERSTSESE